MVRLFLAVIVFYFPLIALLILLSSVSLPTVNIPPMVAFPTVVSVLHDKSVVESIVVPPPVAEIVSLFKPFVL